MNIERAIYASLPIGIDTDSNGLQFYSYTSGFKKLLEQDTTGTLKGLAAGSYKFPIGSDWLRDLPEDIDINGDLSAYPLRIPETVSEANKIEQRVRRFSPYSFCYKPISLGEESGALFLFGKNLGMDWSGGRPGNPYIYFVACGINEVKKSPILYCSSPAVTCDIPRSEFYPEDSSLRKPSFLSAIKSLNDVDNIAPLSYSAGFNSIAPNEIIEFVNEEGRLEIMLSMLSSIMEYKDGNARRRIVIADSCDNILMWIATLSYIFPEANTRELSFSTYTFAPEEYDINGVFVPALNSCPDTVKTGYEFNIVRNAYAVYDFSEEYYAPEVPVKTGLFMSIIKNSFEINTSLIDNYKKYIHESTTYKGTDSEYATGYDLFAFMTNMVKYEFENAIDFAIKYALPTEKKTLLKKLTSEYVSLATNEANLGSIKRYIDFCIESNIEKKQTIDVDIVNEYIMEFFDNSLDDKTIRACGSIVEKLCGIDDDNLGILLVDTIKLEKIYKFVRETNSSWRILYISRTLCLYANVKKIGITAGSEIGKILTEVIKRLVLDDSIKNAQQTGEYIKELFKTTTAAASCVGLGDSILCGLCEKEFKNCSGQVLGAIAHLYIEGDSSVRSEILFAASVSMHSELIIRSIIDSIRKEPDACRMISLMQDLFIDGGEIVKPFAQNAKMAISNAVKIASAVTPKQQGDIVYATYKFMYMISNDYGVSVALSEYQIIYDMYLSSALSIAPDYILDDSYILKFSEMSDFVEKIGGKTYPDMLCIFKSLNIIKSDIGSKKSNSSFSIKNAPPYEPVNLSRLSNSVCHNYMDSMGLLCAEHWVETGQMPLFHKMFLASKDDKHSFDETVFDIMFRRFLKNTKHNGRHAADIIELSLLWQYDSILESIEYWLKECNVSNSVVSCLDKDIKAVIEMKKSAQTGLLSQIKSSDLQNYAKVVRNYFDNNGNGMLGTLRSFFKRK